MKAMLMDKKQAEEMISILTAEFHILKPKVEFSNIANVGRYSPRLHRIHIGLRCWFGTENLILHEFAHALAYTRYGIIKNSKYRTEWHGPKFAQCLIEIINAWYGNQEKYCWQKEYKRLQTYGPTKAR